MINTNQPTTTTIYTDPNEPGLAWTQTQDDYIASGPYGPASNDHDAARKALTTARDELVREGIECSPITSDGNGGLMFTGEADLADVSPYLKRC
jgi:hypothetical protein